MAPEIRTSNDSNQSLSKSKNKLSNINHLLWLLFFIILISIIYYILFHLQIFPAKQVVISRLNSPDGKLDAVYIQSGAGAMSSGNYLVYIVSKGYDPKEKYNAVFWGKRTHNLAISWRSARELNIQFSKSDIRHFQSYFYPFPKDTSYKIEIRYIQK